MFGLYFFICGLFLGSFLHTTAFRLENEISLLKPSSCESCGKRIGILGLMPIIGFLIQKGKASCCGKSVPYKYPVLELMNGVLLYLLFRENGLSLNLVYEVVIWESLFLIAILDFNTMFIFWQPVLICLIGRGLQIFLIEPESTLTSLAGLFIGAGVFHFISYFYIIARKKEGLGSGDATLVGVLGFILGWQILPSIIFLSSILGILLILVMSLIKKQSLNEAYPFGPALIIGAFILNLSPGLLRNILPWF